MGEWVRRDAVPFNSGNKVAVSHGGGSPAVIAERADAIRAQLAERFEFLGDEIFADAFRRCCVAQARANLLSEYIWDVVEGRVDARPGRKGGNTTGVEAVPAYLWTEVTRAEANAAKFAQECGLDPTGFARIAKELGWAKQLAGNKVNDLMATGKELRRGSGS